MPDNMSIDLWHAALLTPLVAPWLFWYCVGVRVGRRRERRGE